jgi:hypothetical protein
MQIHPRHPEYKHPASSWRKIEQQLADYFRSEGCELETDSGDIFLCWAETAIAENGAREAICWDRVSLSELARQLAVAAS